MTYALGATASAQAGWHAPERISSRGGFSRVVTAVNARGDTLAVWDRWAGPYPDETSYAIEAAYRPAGLSWQRAVVVSRLGAPCDREACGLPSLSAALGPQGEAVVAWTEAFVTGPAPLWAVSRSADGHWQAPVVLDPIGGVSAQVVMDASGNATAIWSGDASAVRVASKPVDGDWGAPVTLGTGYSPQLASNANGDLAAVWANGIAPGGSTVQAATRPAGGAWGEPVAIAALPGAGPQAHVAVDPAGDAMVSWDSEAPGECACASTLETAYRPAGGQWGSPMIIGVRHRGRLGDLQIALGQGARATAVWSDTGRVKASSSTSGGAWRSPVTLASTHRTVVNLQLAGNASGELLAAWLHPVRGHGFYGANLQGIETSSVGKRQHAINFGRRLTQDDINPAVEVDSRGIAVAAWVHTVGKGWSSFVEAATFTSR